MVGMLFVQAQSASAQSTRRCTYSCQQGTVTRPTTRTDACSNDTDCVQLCNAICAQAQTNGFDSPATCVTTASAAPRCSGSSSVGVPYDPFVGKTIPEVIGQLVRFLLGLVGALMLVMFIYGGFTWMLAQGDSKKVDSAKKILTNAVIGMVLIMFSYAILSVFLSYLTVLDVAPTTGTEPGASSGPAATPGVTLPGTPGR